MATTAKLDWEYDGPVIRATGVEKHFPQNSGIVNQLIGGERSYVKAVDGVDLEVNPGETVGLVGESGCGKSTLAEVLIGLQKPTAGTIEFLGQDLATMGQEEKKAFRRGVQMIFQDPYESINPRFTVEQWLREPLEIHGLDNKDERIHQALERAELQPTETMLSEHAHQLSGGQRQRVSIARALVLEPKFIVADEPVSMLDVSARASILDLLESLVQEMDMGALYISHDISLIRQMSHRMSVMYLGNIIEEGPTEAIINNPSHPYTRALLDSVPVPDPSQNLSAPSLTDEPPDPVDLPEGCNFRPRCPYAADECFQEPTLDSYNNGTQRSACLRVEEIDEVQ